MDDDGGLVYLLLIRVAAKQHLTNFAKHDILIKLFECRENEIVDFREILN